MHCTQFTFSSYSALQNLSSNKYSCKTLARYCFFYDNSLTIGDDLCNCALMLIYMHPLYELYPDVTYCNLHMHYLFERYMLLHPIYLTRSNFKWSIMVVSLWIFNKVARKCLIVGVLSLFIVFQVSVWTLWKVHYQFYVRLYNFMVRWNVASEKLNQIILVKKY